MHFKNGLLEKIDLLTCWKLEDQRDSLISDVWVYLIRIKGLVVARLNVIHNYIVGHCALSGH